MQAELFEVSRPALERSQAENQRVPGWLDRFQVTLRIDHFLIGGISALVLYVLVFSFGVEKGKRYAFEELKAEKARQELAAEELTKTGSPPLPDPASKEVLPAKGTSAVSAAPAPSAPPTFSTPVTEGYTIQLATYLTRRQAEESAAQFKKRGFHGFVVPKGKYFLLCIEAFQNLGEARERLTRLKADGFIPSDAFIRPAKGNIPG